MPDEELPASDLARSRRILTQPTMKLLAKYELEDRDHRRQIEARRVSSGEIPGPDQANGAQRMWRLNPMFRFADEMVEYGENYLDAATVIDGMTLTYPEQEKAPSARAFDAVDEAPADERWTPDVEPAAAPEDTPEVSQQLTFQRQASATDEEASEVDDEANQSAGKISHNRQDLQRLMKQPLTKLRSQPIAQRMVFGKSDHPDAENRRDHQ